MIATPEHRDTLAAALREAAVDVDAALADGRLVALDAADTLAEFLVTAAPDAAAFDEVVGGVSAPRGGVVEACVRSARWSPSCGMPRGDGRDRAERLWEALGHAHRSPCSPRTRPSPCRALGLPTSCRRCATSTRRSWPEGQRAATREAVRRFAASVHSPRLARQFVSETLRGWGLPKLVEDLRVVVAELAANAVRHAASTYAVSVRGGVIGFASRCGTAARPCRCARLRT